MAGKSICCKLKYFDAAMIILWWAVYCALMQVHSTTNVNQTSICGLHSLQNWKKLFIKLSNQHHLLSVRHLIDGVAIFDTHVYFGRLELM